MTFQQPKFSNIERAVAFIQSELVQDRTPTLNDVANAAHISPFHFHRIFRLLTGETCAQMITRLRLAKGTSALQRSSTSITEAAFAAGYGSGQAFAKAIKREFLASASDIRSDPERLAKSIQTLSTPDETMTEAAKPAIRIEIASLEPLEVLTIRTENIYPELIDTYGLLFETAGGPDNVRAVIGLPHGTIEAAQEGEFTFIAALLTQTPIPADQDGVERGTVQAGPYLLARHKGPDEQMPETLNALYMAILESPDIDFAETPCVHHYIDDPEFVDESICRTDLYVPIKLIAS